MSITYADVNQASSWARPLGLRMFEYKVLKTKVEPNKLKCLETIIPTRSLTLLENNYITKDKCNFLIIQ